MAIFAKSGTLVKSFADRVPPNRPFFYDALRGYRVKRYGRNLRACCPGDHHGDNPTSFCVNEDTGLWHCKACNAGGKGVVAFVRWRDACDFETALRTLGIWEERGPMNANQRRETAIRLAAERRRKEKIAQAAEALAEQERVLRIAIRRRLRAIEKRIVQLTDSPMNNEFWWTKLARLHSLQRLAVAGFWVMSFGDTASRVAFLRGDRATRVAMASDVLLKGFVVDDDGVCRYFDHDAPMRQANGRAHGIPWSEVVA